MKAIACFTLLALRSLCCIVNLNFFYCCIQLLCSLEVQHVSLTLQREDSRLSQRAGLHPSLGQDCASLHCFVPENRGSCLCQLLNNKGNSFISFQFNSANLFRGAVMYKLCFSLIYGCLLLSVKDEKKSSHWFQNLVMIPVKVTMRDTGDKASCLQQQQQGEEKLIDTLNNQLCVEFWKRNCFIHDYLC